MMSRLRICSVGARAVLRGSSARFSPPSSLLLSFGLLLPGFATPVPSLARRCSGCFSLPGCSRVAPLLCKLTLCRVPLLTHTLYLVHSFSLCTLWDHCAVIYCFCQAFNWSKKEIQKDCTKNKQKKSTSQNRLNPYVCSPFSQTACWHKFTSLFTGMLFLATGILGTSQQLDFVQTYIHMISLCSHICHFQDECAKEFFL